MGEGQANICVVSWPEKILGLKHWASQAFAIPQDHAWRTITPLVRAPITPSRPNLLLVGDAARVVEPFTGEGIYYALASGELAAKAIVAGIAVGDLSCAGYRRAHAELYRGRLWVNHLARAAMVRPLIGDALLQVGQWNPGFLRSLTGKVMGKP